MRRSIFQNLMLTYLLIFLLFVGFFGYLLYEFSQLKGYSITVDHSGALRMSFQGIAKAAKVYYIKSCIEKGKSEETLEKINKFKNRVGEAFLALKEGKGGAKTIKSIGEEKALTLLTDLEKGYGELFSLVDKLTQTCDRELITKLDETSDKVLALAVELTPFIAKKSVSEMNKVRNSAIILLFFIIFLLAFSYLKSNKDLKAVFAEVNNELKNIEKFKFTGSFNERVIFKEFEDSIEAVESLKNSLALVIKGINASSQTIVESVNTIRADSEEINPVSQKIESLVREVSQIGQEVTELLTMVERGSEEMKLAISEISKNTIETSNRAKRLRASSTEMETQVLNLEKSMSQIREISETIRGIAEQTNLLALNASIEAARAGEAGKGFAVVANEVKELAKKVSDFIGEIEKIIGELEDAVRDTVQKARESNLMVDEVEEATSVIAGAVEEQTAVVSGIVENTTQAKEKSFVLVSNVEDLNRVAETLTKIIKHLEINANLIEEIAGTLSGFVNIVELSEKPLSDEDLQKMSTVALVKTSIVGHINWKMGFLRAVLKGEVPKVERDHHRCLLGRALPYLKQRLVNTPILSLVEALETLHAKLHSLVEVFEKEVNINNIDEIFKFVEKEVLLTFENLMKLLLEIIEGCKKYKCD